MLYCGRPILWLHLVCESIGQKTRLCISRKTWNLRCTTYWNMGWTSFGNFVYVKSYTSWMTLSLSFSSWHYISSWLAYQAYICWHSLVISTIEFCAIIWQSYKQQMCRSAGRQYDWDGENYTVEELTSDRQTSFLAITTFLFLHFDEALHDLIWRIQSLLLMDLSNFCKCNKFLDSRSLWNEGGCEE